MTDRVAIHLLGGQWIVLDLSVLQDALHAGAALFGHPATQAKSEVEPLLKAADLAQLLNVPQSRLESAARQGRIPAVRVGRYVRFRRSEVERALST